MNMTREKETQLAANKTYPLSGNHHWVEDVDMKNEAFVNGAEWADAHPKKVDNDCKFCKQEEVVNHRSKECDLSYDGEAICVDIDIPLTWGSATGYYGFSINYFPMCGRKLSK